MNRVIVYWNDESTYTGNEGINQVALIDIFMLNDFKMFKRKLFSKRALLNVTGRHERYELNDQSARCATNADSS